jgi:RNA-directed DNA polymerase
LANLTLDGLERLLKETFRRKEIRGQAYNPKVNFVRYADDFIITGCSKELLENEVKPLVERFMLERGLQLSPEKTCITHIEQGFDFLGQNLRKYGGKLLITPSKKNMHAFLEKVRGQIRSNRATKQEYLIRLLNPVIRGWAYYHRHIEAGSAYRKVGMVLWHSLWRWAKRRHPNKSPTWIVDRYWHRLGRRSWCFAVLSGSNAQRSRTAEVRLVNPTEIPIRRYVKVKSDANPFDLYWRGYFESRKRFR